MRHYNKVTHRCSRCGWIMDEESFKTHSEAECFMYEMEKMKNEDKWNKIREKRHIKISTKEGI